MKILTGTLLLIMSGVVLAKPPLKIDIFNYSHNPIKICHSIQAGDLSHSTGSALAVVKANGTECQIVGINRAVHFSTISHSNPLSQGTIGITSVKLDNVGEYRAINNGYSLQYSYHNDATNPQISLIPTKRGNEALNLYPCGTNHYCLDYFK